METPSLDVSATDDAETFTLWMVLILGALTAFASLSIDMYLPAFPRIAQDLQVPFGTVQMSLSAFLFGTAAGQALYGPLSDCWGRRRPLLFGLALFIAASIGCAFAESAGALIAWRLAMALGGAAGMVISRAVVRDLCDATESARIYSLLMLVMGVSPILAPMVGGQLLLVTGWRGIFALLATIGLTCLAAVTLGLPESMPEERRSGGNISSFLGLYGRLLRDRRFTPYAVAVGCVAGVNFAYITGSPFVFIELNGVSPQHFGLFFGVNAFGLVGCSQLNRRLLRRYTPRQILNVAFPIHAVAALLLALCGVSGLGGFYVIPPLLFVCLATAGFLFPNLTALAMTPFGAVAGSASALLGTLQFSIGGGAGALVGLLHNGTTIPMTATVAVCGLLGYLTVRGRAET